MNYFYSLAFHKTWFVFLLLLLATMMVKKCFFTVLCKGFVVIHLITCQLGLWTFKGEIKKNRMIMKVKAGSLPLTISQYKKRLEFCSPVCFKVLEQSASFRGQDSWLQHHLHRVPGGLFTNVRFHLSHRQHRQVTGTADLNSQMEGAVRTATAAACWLVVQIATSGWAHTPFDKHTHRETIADTGLPVQIFERVNQGHAAEC